MGCKTSIIPNYVTSIGNYAFYDTALTSVSIPDSVISIEDCAFAGCVGSSLTSVTIGNSVTSIGRAAFYNCKSLTSINIPNSVTSIGRNAFASCSKLTSINIPDSVTLIDQCAFEACQALTSIVIPNSVTSIEYYAFGYCFDLKTVIIKGKPTVSSKAFSSPAGTKLEKIYVIEGKGYTSADTIAGIPIEILPADGAVVAKTMNVKSMTIS